MNAVVALRTPEKLGLKVEDYLRLVQAGAFADHGKTELIEGDVFAMNAQFSRHARVKTRLTGMINEALRALGSDLEALVEVSVALSDDSMPEPDISLTRYTGDDPAPADTVALVIEVADTTMAIDLGRKVALYARHGIAEYWVVDVEERQINMMSMPSALSYQKIVQIPFGLVAKALTISGLSVETSGL